MDGGNQLSIPDNIRALWARMEHTQRTVEDRDRHIHTLETQLNGVLQTLATLQQSHQNLQDTVCLNSQEVDKEITTVRSQLDFLRGEHLLAQVTSIATIPDQQPSTISTGPTPQVMTGPYPNPITSNPSEPNLKPAKPDAWDGTDHDAKPFQN